MSRKVLRSSLRARDRVRRHCTNHCRRLYCIKISQPWKSCRAKCAPKYSLLRNGRFLLHLRSTSSSTWLQCGRRSPSGKQSGHKRIPRGIHTRSLSTRPGFQENLESSRNAPRSSRLADYALPRERRARRRLSATKLYLRYQSLPVARWQKLSRASLGSLEVSPGRGGALSDGFPAASDELGTRRHTDPRRRYKRASQSVTVSCSLRRSPNQRRQLDNKTVSAVPGWIPIRPREGRVSSLSRRAFLHGRRHPCRRRVTPLLFSSLPRDNCNWVDR